jgi:hypothetical protein
MEMSAKQWQWLPALSIAEKTAPIARFTAAQKFHFMYFNQQEDRAMTILKHIQDVKTMLGQDVIVLFSGKRFYEAYGDDALKIKSCCECITDSRISDGERL